MFAIWDKTGNIRFRSTWRGKLVLQVQERTTHWSDSPGSWQYRWRDAKTDDMEAGPIKTFSGTQS